MNKFKIVSLVLKDLAWNKITRKGYLVLIIWVVAAFGTGPIGFKLSSDFWPNVPVVGHSMNLLMGHGWHKGILEANYEPFSLHEYYTGKILKKENSNHNIFLLIIIYTLFGVVGSILLFIPIIPPAILLIATLCIYLVLLGCIKFINWSKYIPLKLKKYFAELKERV